MAVAGQPLARQKGPAEAGLIVGIAQTGEVRLLAGVGHALSDIRKHGLKTAADLAEYRDDRH